MALQFRGRRSKLISNLNVASVAIFALLLQPVVALNLPAVFADELDSNKPVIGETNPYNDQTIYKSDGQYTIKAQVNDDDGDLASVKWYLTGAYKTDSDNESHQDKFEDADGDGVWEGTYALNHPSFPTGNYTGLFVAIDEAGNRTEKEVTGITLLKTSPVEPEPTEPANTSGPDVTEITPTGNVKRGAILIKATVSDIDGDSVKSVTVNLKNAENPKNSYKLSQINDSNVWSVEVDTTEFVQKGTTEKFALYMTAIDEHGKSKSSVPGYVTIDGAGPSISAKTPTEGAIISGTSYTVSAIIKDSAGVKTDSVYARFRDDAGKEYTIYLAKQNDEGLYSAQVDTTKIGNGNTGPNRVSFRAVDSLGNPRSSVSENVRIDNTAPAISNIVVKPLRNDNIGRIVTVTFDMDDATGADASRTRIIFGNEKAVDKNHKREAVKNPTCTQDDTTATKMQCTVIFDTTTFVNQNHTGVYTLGFNPYDTLGNQTSMKPVAFRNMLIDNSGPGSTLVAPGSGSTVRSGTETERFVFAVKDDTGVKSGYMNLNGPTSKQYSLTQDGNSDKWYADVDTAQLKDGQYQVDARFVDSFGTPRYGANKGTITVDKTAPNITEVRLNGTVVNVRYANCDSITKSYIVRGEIDLSAIITDEGGDVEDARYTVRKVASNGCSLTSEYRSNNIVMAESADDEWITNQGSRFDTNSIGKNGQYTIILVTKDGVGNQAVRYIDLDVDNTAPVLTINDPIKNSDGTYTVTGTSDDDAPVVISINGDDAGDATLDEGDTWTFTTQEPLAAGEYTFGAVSTDEAGNQSPIVTRIVTVTAAEAEQSAPDNGGGSVTDRNNTAQRPVRLPTAQPQQSFASQQPLFATFGANTVPQTVSDNNDDATEDDEDVLAAEDNQQNGEVTNQAANSESEVLGDEDENGCWKLLGLCWYWWIPIVAAVVGIVWFIKKLRDEDDGVDTPTRRLQ